MHVTRVGRASAVLILFFALTGSASAATLSVGSVSGTVGQTVSVPVTVSAGSGESLNAVSVNISFPTDKLSLTSISKASSIISLWAQEPVYSNVNGTAALEGIIPNPGYSGSSGRVALLTFTIKAAGSATVSFSSASVLANDGQGTNILRSSNPGTITGSAGAAPAPTPAPAAPSSTEPAEESEDESVESDEGLPKSAFTITSKTHPEQLSWYRADTGTFSWPVPPGASATRLLLSQSASAIPSVAYPNAIGEKTIDELPEGTSYLAVQHQVGGVWGEVGRYRVNVDTTPPRSFRITFPHGSEGFNPQPIILFNTLDGESGIDHYDVRVGAGDLLRKTAAADSNPYMLPMLEPGTHTVRVTAYDRAGNETSDEASVEVEGIEAPRFTHYEEVVTTADNLKLRGITYENADVNVHIYDEDGVLVTEEFTRSNTLGDFAVLISKHLSAGEYTVTARVTDDRGARSLESSPLPFTIEGRFFTILQELLYDYLAPLIVFVTAVGGALYVLFIAAERLLRSMKGLNALGLTVRREPSPEDTTHKAFMLLKQDLASYRRILAAAKKHRELTGEEEAFLERFKEDLTDAESVITETIKKRRAPRRVKKLEVTEE
ncbi:MAG: hypothetical protein KBC38_02810 [Candidatus Pacebacteria bacterium]|nr:hypothetical protein [Candidatus Paceibacterota bacterium]MBP9840312.1 hypothetical protein [Candidatus Paceibacterota bacterium]